MWPQKSSFHCMYASCVFTYSYKGGGLDWFYFSAVVDSTICNVGKTTLYNMLSFAYRPRGEFLDHLVVLFLFNVFPLCLSFCLFSLKLSLCLYLNVLCTCVHGMHVMIRGNLALSFRHVGPWHLTQVTSLELKPLIPLSYLVCSSFIFSFSFKICVCGLVQIFTEARRGCQIPWSRSYVVVSCLTWMLRTKTLPPVRAVVTSYLASSHL